jgi:hypothetical protein
MGLLDKVKQQQKVPNSLDAIEIEFILSLIKNSEFKGENLEIVYNTVIKLQDQYLALNK